MCACMMCLCGAIPSPHFLHHMQSVDAVRLVCGTKCLHSRYADAVCGGHVEHGECCCCC